MPEKGKFVVSEGASMAGKTTQVNLIKPCLGQGWEFYREPGGTPFGEDMRSAVQQLGRLDVDPVAELLAYSASRAQLIRTVVIPALTVGTNIWLDRYWYSSYAYQGHRVSKEVVRAVTAIATDDLEPDLVLYYDVTPEVTLERMKNKIDLDIHDVKDLDFKRRVRDNYLELAAKYPDIWVVIDASKSIQEVFEDSLRVLQERGIWIP